VDNDPQALVATLDNAARNGVASKIYTVLPADLPTCQAGLLLANILANPLIELAPHFAGLVAAGGDLVLSGILADQAATVSAAYQRDFSIQPTVQREDWVRLSGMRHQ
jgi:ribosomal protein L11 methyltransferase